MVVSAALVATPARAALLSALGLTLVAAAAVDWRSQRLPNRLTIVVGILTSVLAMSRGLTPTAEGIVAAAVTSLALLGIRAIGRRRSGEPGLGLGDVKLIAATSIWLGAATPWLLVCAATIGLCQMALTRPASGRIGFGPAIAAGSWIVGISLEAGAWPTTL